MHNIRLIEHLYDAYNSKSDSWEAKVGPVDVHVYIVRIIDIKANRKNASSLDNRMNQKKIMALEQEENEKLYTAKSISHLFRDYVRLQWISTVDQYDVDLGTMTMRITPLGNLLALHLVHTISLSLPHDHSAPSCSAHWTLKSNVLPKDEKKYVSAIKWVSCYWFAHQNWVWWSDSQQVYVLKSFATEKRNEVDGLKKENAF